MTTPHTLNTLIIWRNQDADSVIDLVRADFKYIIKDLKIERYPASTFLIFETLVGTGEPIVEHIGKNFPVVLMDLAYSETGDFSNGGKHNMYFGPLKAQSMTLDAEQMQSTFELHQSIVGEEQGAA